jgi:subtilisin family serine protease
VAVLAVAASGLPVPASAAGRSAVPPAATSAAVRPPAGLSRYVVLLRAPDGGRERLRPRASRDPAARARARADADARAAVTGQTIDALEVALGFRASQRYGYAVDGFAARLTEAQAAALRTDPRVRSVAPDRPVRPAGGPVVPAGIARVHAAPTGLAQTWSVDVAVVDTGVGRFDAPSGTWLHEGELNVVGGVDAVSSSGGACGARVSGPVDYADTLGHGTHVAGTIGAIDNGLGAVGVAPGARLWSVRVFQGLRGSDATVICGLDWIAAHNAGSDEANDIDVVNMSLRGPAPANTRAGCEDPGNTDAEELAVCRVALSATVVAAAGNETEPVAGYVPARYESVIAVSAISDFDGAPGGLSAETCVPPRGRETDDAFSRYSNYGSEVDVAAPGTCVVSTARSARDGLTSMSGTSMATPHVSGAAARYLAERPGTGWAAVRSALMASASLDWDAATDPDGRPDRLLDVEALMSTSPALALDVVPAAVPVPAGTRTRRVMLALQRIGGLSDAVTVTVGPLPAGVASAALDDGGAVPADAGEVDLVLTFDEAPPDGERALTIVAQPSGGAPAATIDLPLRFDATIPAIGAPWPSLALARGLWRTAAPIRLSWTASDPGEIVGQEVQRSLDGGPFRTLLRPSPAATRADTTITPGGRRAFRIRAGDAVGNVGTSSAIVTRLLVHETSARPVGHSSDWGTRPDAAASDGSVIAAEPAGATADLAFTGRSVAIVARRARDAGRIEIVIDGVPAGRVDLSRGAAGARRIVFASGLLTAGPHTIQVVTLGGRVELDAILVLR